MDLEAVADELYSASPDEFVERRQQRVVEARAAKDRPLVKAITALRRPTRSAWLVNLLARDAADEVAALLDLGSALADAQRKGAGTELRRLSRERHTALEGLTRRAVELGAQHGHVATDATRQEVSQTLQAGLADPSVAELLRIGRVVQPASYGGFGPMDLFAPAPAKAAAAPETGEPQQLPDPEGAPADAPAAESAPVDQEAERAQREAEELAQAAAETVAAAAERVADAAQAAREATSHADELADRVEDLRSQLAQAEAEEQAAREQARAARRAQQDAQRQLDEAEQAAAEASRALARSQPH